MQRAGLIVVSWLSASLVGCGGADTGASEGARPAAEAERSTESDASRPEGIPDVEVRYQERIDEAWGEAVAGENPATTCAAVKGRAVASAAGSGERAVAACNVDIPVRYFLTVADRVEAGEKTCNDLMMAVMTQLPAMTMSMEGFRDLAQQRTDADTSDAAAAAAGTAILAGEAASGGGANDPRQAVKERLRDRVTEVCPQEAGVILR
jgi:hypothetical protein